MKERNLTTARVEKNICIAAGIFSMEIFAPEIAKNARAGQFVMVYMDRGELLLPRPISICDVDAETVTLVYQVVGKGTKVMSEMRAGQDVKILGALGNGFDIDGKNRVTLVGGGIGAPPILFLAKTLAARGAEFDIFLGFRSEPILVEKFMEIKTPHIATEDGSAGHRGRITDILSARDEIMACGPLPMLRAVAAFASEKNIPCQVCMEERMACGLGTCVGCVVKAGESYVRVCSEGPVFYTTEVELNA